MRTNIIILLLGLFLLAGCERDPADLLTGSSGEMTHGFCLVSGDQVLLNDHDIEYYDFGAHLIYLKPHMSTEQILKESEELQGEGTLKVYAGGDEIYGVTIQPGYSSLMPDGPVIWNHPTFYPDHVLAISLINSYQVLTGSYVDVREDPRVVQALKKYGQYMEGLHAEILSVWYGSPDELRLNIVVSNRDRMNYYYLDPEKMGMGLYHYFTNGVSLRETGEHQFYTHRVEPVQPSPWDRWDLDWMSLLEGGESVNITLEYNNFENVPPGSYQVLFRFPGLQSQVERGQQDQRQGRIWLGQLILRGELVVR